MRTIYASAASSAAEYYTRYLTDAPGEVPGVWTGQQAGRFGLAGAVNGNELQVLLEGRDPVVGTPLGRVLKDRQLANGTVEKAVGGFDATFSAPKSLSVLWALTQDPRLLDAHDVAVTAALAHLERYGSTTRARAAGGRLHPDSQGLAIAAFRQTTSREDDPQIHTHAVISAKVQTVEGRWLALDARYLKKHQRILGGLYQSVLRNELTHRFGVAWDPIVAGQAEIAGMPPDLLKVFSKRTDQIDVALTAKVSEFATREGRDPNQWELGALKREAAVDTRASKTGNGVAELVTRWITEAQSAGWTLTRVVAAVGEAAREAGRDQVPPTVGHIMDALSHSGSTWSRAQIVGAICDTAAAQRALDGAQWAQTIEGWCDQVVEQCVELDPARAAAPRRASDGRSLWIEPIAPHLTSETIIAEEERILTWAADAQLDEPRPSTTVDCSGLDALQADVAASVAGNDRLVLVVGPAGAGKTTTLRAAIDDLATNGRAVFGVAPSAKAARVLERETGVPSDTLAKLLHEHERGDRPPAARYRLPAGTTVLVDEAGMIGTPSLARLIRLADQQAWRLALVGDPHQLQAVGRGGLFHELCTTGRVTELTRIHRFTAPWEAAASLLLRHGDPRGLDPYLAHDRIVADTFEGVLEALADKWLATTAESGTVAITASANEHVDAINNAVQHARLLAGQLDRRQAVSIGGGEHAHAADIVVTRRNERTITTDAGEPIRNREIWTVSAVASDGSLTVSSLRGSGQATLPADYVAHHVRLGYAATEHGNQGDTTTVGIEVATAVTTRRGLYVGATRGRDENLIFTVTESRDLDEARDTLERILATDRADRPATAQRRELATVDRQPGHRAPQPTPRCEIPGWFHDLRTEVRAVYEAHAERARENATELESLHTRLAKTQQQEAKAARAVDPYRPALDEAARAVREAQENWWAANRAHMHTSGLKRRRTQRDVDRTSNALDAAREAETGVKALAAPAVAAMNQAGAKVYDLRTSIDHVGWRARLDDLGDRPTHAVTLDTALDTWARWANGQTIDPHQLGKVVPVLRDQTIVDPTAPGALADAVEQAIHGNVGQTADSQFFSRHGARCDLGIGIEM